MALTRETWAQRSQSAAHSMRVALLRERNHGVRSGRGVGKGGRRPEAAKSVPTACCTCHPVRPRSQKRNTPSPRASAARQSLVGKIGSRCKMSGRVGRPGEAAIHYVRGAAGGCVRIGQQDAPAQRVRLRYGIEQWYGILSQRRGLMPNTAQVSKILKLGCRVWKRNSEMTPQLLTCHLI